MSEKINLPGGGYLEAERPEERSTAFHKKIMEITPIPNTKSGNHCLLECGHRVMTFGNLSYAAGVTLCVQCRDAALR